MIDIFGIEDVMLVFTLAAFPLPVRKKYSAAKAEVASESLPVAPFAR